MDEVQETPLSSSQEIASDSETNGRSRGKKEKEKLKRLRRASHSIAEAHSQRLQSSRAVPKVRDGPVHLLRVVKSLSRAQHNLERPSSAPSQPTPSNLRRAALLDLTAASPAQGIIQDAQTTSTIILQPSPSLEALSGGRGSLPSANSHP